MWWMSKYQSLKELGKNYQHQKKRKSRGNIGRRRIRRRHVVTNAGRTAAYHIAAAN